MNGHTLRTSIFAAVCTVCSSAVVNAAESPEITPSELQAIMKKHQIKTRGQNVRMSAKLRFAIDNMLSMPSAARKLSSADMQSMQEFYRTQPDSSRALKILDEMCAELARQENDGETGLSEKAYSVATFLDQSAQESDRVQLAHYQKQVNSLSVPAKEVLDESMRAIRDENLGSSRLDYFGIAEDAPKFIVDRARESCATRSYAPKEGRTHPGVKVFTPTGPSSR